MAKKQPLVGIDDMALYVPNLFLELSDLAAARGIPYEKLKQGLDLYRMSVCDIHEDAATMAAEAVLELFERNQLNPNEIGRIYLGTESALDAAKPTATYAVAMVEDALSEKWGVRSLRRCDVVDMTFACIGATDALQNCLDWVSVDSNRKAIVIASDIAKYELGSTGEYTQGAGAVAMLVKQNPRLIAIKNKFGVATESVHDFFKPRRSVEKSEIVKSVLAEAGILNGQAEKVMAGLTTKNDNILAMPDKSITIFREMPVFDGQFSNQCYTKRALEAMQHFGEQVGFNAKKPIFDRWKRMIFHLPYAAHARRIGVDIFLSEMSRIGKLNKIEQKAQVSFPDENTFIDPKAFFKAQNAYLKTISETADYQDFVKGKLEAAAKLSSQVGNIYTGSIFLALISALELELTDNHDVNDNKASEICYGFVAYGSGSKSKVFEGVLQPEWKGVASKLNAFEKLKQRKAISFEEYEALHTGFAIASMNGIHSKFGLNSICEEGQLEGTRNYSVLL